MVLRHIWGKSEPFQPLLYHMIDVGFVSQQLVKNGAFSSILVRLEKATGCEKTSLLKWIGFLLALHDMGKCSADFQAKDEDLMKPLIDADLLFRSEREPGFRHEATSERWIMEYLREECHWGQKAINTIAVVIRGHHGNFHSKYTYEEDILVKSWNPVRDKIVGRLREVFQPNVWKPDLFPEPSVVGVLLSGLLVLTDWIASNPSLFQYPIIRKDVSTYYSFSKDMAEKAIDRIGLLSKSNWYSYTTFKDVWQTEEFSNLRPVQEKCEELYQENIEPGLVIIEAPMGEGKTEAAVYIAIRLMASLGKEGMYIGLPTAATSNQMHSRMKAFLDQHNRRAAKQVKLVHGMAWILDSKTPESSSVFEVEDYESEIQAIEWFKPKKRALLTPYAVGTIDQALMSVLNVRFGFLRLFGLGGKVLVIDEVHAYDAYMSRILTRLLQWAAAIGIPTILLSATLPASKKKRLIEAYTLPEQKKNGPADPGGLNSIIEPYPLITIARQDGFVTYTPVERVLRESSIKLEIHPGSLGKPEEIAQIALDASSRGGCVCVIANTVKSAQDIYKKLKSKSKSVKSNTITLLLFHARFPAQRRIEIEKKVVKLFGKGDEPSTDHQGSEKRPKRAILVATQVVEQSLDLDFDEMVTEIAPVDLILQRVGRLHRHERQERPTGKQPKLHVLLPEDPITNLGQTQTNLHFGSSEMVYDPFILAKTWSVIRKMKYIELPADLRPLVEEVYNDKIESMTTEFTKYLQQVKQKKEIKNKEEELKAGPYLIPPPSRKEFCYIRLPNVVYNDEDGDAASYFAAKTRLGNNTVKALLFEGNEYQEVLLKKTKPPNKILKEIMLRSVNIPKWWIKDVEPVDGYQPLGKGSKWIYGSIILYLSGDTWKGKDRKGRIISLHNDQNLGVERFLGESRE